MASESLERIVSKLMKQEHDRQKLAKAIARLIREEQDARADADSRRRYHVPKS